jgi:TrmH family RNA methyltransferase
MLSHNQIKLIRSLKQKKSRQSHRLFVVEGLKSIEEFSHSNYLIKEIYTVDANIADKLGAFLISTKQMSQISFLKTPNVVLALIEIPLPEKFKENGLLLALDDVSDPGNLGTIIRLCDWFGVAHLICSENTVDCYNEKVVQASMGSLSRVRVHYLDLAQFIKQYNGKVFGAFMDGEVIYKQSLPENAIVIMGNEGRGVSNDIEKLVQEKVSIPQFGYGKPVESLNVATATAIILNEFRRSAY